MESGTKLTSAQRILERAIEVLEHGGEAAIRTNIIANECGVSAPILYRAFDSREGLVIAAQSERYRRATATAAGVVVSAIESATSREDLRANISRALDFVFDFQRATNRRLRAEVVGSAVSRPELAERIVSIDREYAETIYNAYERAIREGWVSTSVNLKIVARWAQWIINASISAEFEDDEVLRSEWAKLSKEAILSAIFAE
jgi:AcrR family transcriptional regulator